MAASSVSAIPFRPQDLDRPTPHRFERIAEAFPGRIAVQASGRAITYEALNRQANRIAHALLAARGEGPEPIALCFAAAEAAIPAMLGVLKAGKFYVQLDPSYPGARLAAMVADADARAIVTNAAARAAADTAARHSPAPADVLDADALGGAGPDTNPRIAIGPDSLQYVLYTSGSTGAPKGVMHTHRNALNGVWLSTRTLAIAPSDRFAFLSSVGFTMSEALIYNALLNGASVHPYHFLTDGFAGLGEWLRREGATNLELTPTILRHFAAALEDPADGAPGFPDIRALWLVGETILRRDVELFRRHFPPPCVLRISYGSAETRLVSLQLVDHATPVPDSVVPVGRVVEGVRVWIADEAGTDVGLDRPGEIVVESTRLSPGYWRHPELTASAFRDVPDGGAARRFFTGDLGALRSDGMLVHLGRRDFQVKVRGQRVELGEIEMALLDIAGVKEAAVVARRDRGDTALAGFVVAEPGHALTRRDLRRRLAATLPDHMVPTSLLFLPALPLSPNGKIDRAALPAVERARGGAEGPPVAPRTPFEEALARIWSEALGISLLGVEDDFFDLGGNSLIAAAIASSARHAFRVELPVSALLEAPTVARMAEVVAQHLAERAGPADVTRMLDALGGSPEREGARGGMTPR